jgi:membrane protein implicated in regulation of membrane protease activity
MLWKILFFIIAIWLLFEIIEHIFVPLIWLIFKGKSRNSRRLQEDLSDRVALIKEWHKNRGLVELEGEYWNAFSEFRLRPGQKVRIKNREGLKLHVIPYENKNDIKGINL